MINTTGAEGYVHLCLITR